MKQESFEAFMADVFTSSNYQAPKPENPFESEEYEQFVQSMVPYCRCKESNRPCDGVLAGGLCDDVQEPPEDYEDRDDTEDDLP